MCINLTIKTSHGGTEFTEITKGIPDIYYCFTHNFEVLCQITLSVGR
jgi:hypothetical protein